jgi:hypothetical protein
MTPRLKILFGACTFAAVAFVGIALIQARAVDRKARGLHAHMSLSEVMRELDGWRMINTHPAGRRAIPNGTGPEFNGYAGDMYRLASVQPDGRETGWQTLSRAEFVARLEHLLSDGEPWIVYFSYRTVPTHRGILVRFNGQGRIASDGR